MREMKDSGLQWAGNIPYDWNTTKGKYFMAILERPIKDDDGVITCFRNGEVTLRANRREDGFTIATVEAGYQGIEPGDLVIHGMDGFAGAIGISDSRGKGTPALNVLACSENKKYIMYLLRAMAYTEVFMALSTGIRVRTCDTNWKKLRSLDYLIPPEEEQQRIADFLDDKCAEIDTLTADIQTQIDTLEQYKRSVITETVTKGLDPDAEMKDSGIQWIGNMPVHWDVIRGKYILRYMQKMSVIWSFTEWTVSQVLLASPIQEARLLRFSMCWTPTSVSGTSCIICAAWLTVMCFLLWRPVFVCVPVTFGGISLRSFPILYRRWMSRMPS